MGLPGDPGQPMINGVVEFVGFPKGDKGMQVCWETQAFYFTVTKKSVSNIKKSF